MRLVVSIVGDADGGPWEVSVEQRDAARLSVSGRCELTGPCPVTSLDDLKKDVSVAGKELLDWIAPEDAEDRRREIWDTAVRDVTCDLVLDVRAPALRGVPWELLGHERHPFRRSGGAGALVVQDWEDRDVPAPLARLPVHVLVVTGDVDPTVEHGELEALYRALDRRAHEWYVDVLHRPTLTVFEDEYRKIRPHVLHVLGHGVRDGEPAAHGIRIRSDDDGQPWTLDRDVVLNGIHGHGAPNLAVLNGCHTASDTDGLAEGFFESGCSAVVANVGQIEATAAAAFTETFYERLADKKSLHLAAAEARKKVRAEHSTSGTDPVAWARPRLTVATDPRSVLTRSPGLDPREIANREDVGFANLERFVDRTALRRAVNEQLEAGTRLVVISGEPDDVRPVAKSCVVTARANDLNVVYVDLSASDGPVYRDDLCDLITSATKVWQDPTSPIDPDAALGRSRPGEDRDPYGRLKRFLKDPARGGGLILFIDQIDQLHDFDEFFRHFLGRSQENLPVRFVLVATPDWVDDNLASRSCSWINVPPVPLRDGAAFARELLSRRHRHPVTNEDFRIGWEAPAASLLEWIEALASRQRPGPHLDVEALFRECMKRIMEAGLPRELLAKW